MYMCTWGPWAGQVSSRNVRPSPKVGGFLINIWGATHERFFCTLSAHALRAFYCGIASRRVDAPAPSFPPSLPPALKDPETLSYVVG